MTRNCCSVDPCDISQLQSSNDGSKSEDRPPKVQAITRFVKLGALRINSPRIIDDGDDCQRDWKVNDQFVDWDIEHRTSLAAAQNKDDSVPRMRHRLLRAIGL